MTTPEMSPFAETILRAKYAKDEEKDLYDIGLRVSRSVVGEYYPEHVERIARLIAERKFLPGGRQLANAGYSNFLNNCFLYRVADNREGIGEFFRKGLVTGTTGGGVGAVWSDLRPRGSKVTSNGGTSTGPCAFMYSFNEVGRGVVNGGQRRMAIWAGLHWYHPDVYEFMEMKDWSDEIKANKEKDFSAYAPMDMTNVSIILDTDFFDAYNEPSWSKVYKWHNSEGEVVHEVVVTHEDAVKVYMTAVEKMLAGGEPGFSVDAWENEGENLRNPCCEITSHDDSDVCCLGSINMANIDSLEEFEEVVEMGTLFLLCSTLVSDVPHKEVLATREKNRRLGLGLMGIYEWHVRNGLKYEPNEAFGAWLEAWEHTSEWAAWIYATDLEVSVPVKVRAIAPTGTIGIIGETTTGIEPLFALAFKRRYLTPDGWRFQYVIDATAQRMIDEYDVDPETLETAYDLAFDPARRLAMQAFVQEYTDHAISSTLNLPSQEEQPFTAAEFAETLMEHLPSLRGITVYPDGSRGGQPLNVVPYAEALGQEGIEFDEVGLDQACVSGVCGV